MLGFAAVIRDTDAVRIKGAGLHPLTIYREIHCEPRYQAQK